MRKLYIYNLKQQCYFYDEAWVADGQIVEHVGKIGTRGKTRCHAIDPTLSADDNILRVLQPALRGGYKEIAIDDHHVLLIEYTVDDMGSLDDVEKRHLIEQQMDEILGWTGLGHCDGGSSGSGTMEVCCLVVDFEIAKSVITAALSGTVFGDFTRIYMAPKD